MPSSEWRILLPRLLNEAGLSCTKISGISPLTGGVSSDIVKFTTSDGQEFCAKRALSQLKVQEDWTVPIERNQYEIAWLKTANDIHAGCAPKVIAEDADLGIVVLEYLAPSSYYLWKDNLLEGTIDPNIGENVGNVLGEIHAATLNDSKIARQFETDELFDALRLDPYLRYTASVHTDLSEHMLSVLKDTANAKIALVHGDASPKNILVRIGDKQPVLLDAECAWYGDPAFDAAFCLNHFLLKSIHLPESETKFIEAAKRFVSSWLKHFDANTRSNLEKRTALLLPCLFLARIDGKSPVEYLSDASRDKTRKISRQLIQSKCENLDEVFSEFTRLHKESNRKNKP